MKRGVIAGKFLPPHKGHSYLIESGRNQCDELYVLICDRPEYLIPAPIRKSWLEAMHPGVNFIIITDDLDDDDSAGWAQATIELLGFQPDLVFSSEDYGKRWAKHLGAKHIMVDQARVALPVSATMIRNDPWTNWEYLDPEVRAYFTKRICLVGSESSGTTTLTKALAKHYKTDWVPEYGRQYSVDEKERLDREGWKSSDFVTIAQKQNELEDTAAKTANKLLFCDTDSFATGVWHKRYMGGRSSEVEALAAGRRYDLYILTDTHIPFEDDGLRDGEEFREWMQEEFIDKLRFWGKPFILVKGNPQERLEQAVSTINMLVNDSVVQIEGLQRNRWQHQGGF
ncbi:MAG TPA: AAA family ATPase [Candidatus Saccharimonadales bacterium]|nr:AAA family ATPase [Candidatus Saccharimonadales bacterium]